MTVFDVAAILIAVAAVFGYVNHRLVRLPPTSGTLLVSLVSSLFVVVIGQIVPGVQFRPAVQRFVTQIDFDQTLMHGLLCFLLFAGALHVDLEGLVNHRWTIAALSTIGVLLSVVAVGLLTWVVFDLIGLHQRLLVCLTFGALSAVRIPRDVCRNQSRALATNCRSCGTHVCWPHRTLTTAEESNLAS